MGLDVPLAPCYGNCYEHTKEHPKNYQLDCACDCAFRYVISYHIRFTCLISYSFLQSISICYYLFISKNRNLEKFNCPIPPEYYYSIELHDGQRIEVTTETFYYSAFQLRQGLILVIIIIQSILIVGSILLWKFVGLSEKS